MNRFAPTYREALVEAMLWRLGVKPRGGEHDIALVQTIEAALIATGTGIDRFFFDWAGGIAPGSAAGFETVHEALTGYEPSRPLDHPYWQGGEPCSMMIEEVEAIWERIAQADDWSALYDKIERIRAMAEAMLPQP